MQFYFTGYYTEKRLKSRSPGPQAHAHHYLHQANQWPAEAAISWSSRTRVAAARPPPPQRPGPAARGRAPRRRASAWSGRRSACCQCLPRRCREVRARPAGWWAPLCREPAYQKKTRSRVGRARGGARAGQREVVRRTSIARSPRSSTPGGSSAELKSSSTYTSSSSSSFSSSPPFSRRAAASTRADSCAKAICRHSHRGRQSLERGACDLVVNRWSSAGYSCTPRAYTALLRQSTRPRKSERVHHGRQNSAANCARKISSERRRKH